MQSSDGPSALKSGMIRSPPSRRDGVDESKSVMTYVNAYRIHTSAEEVVLDLSFNMPNPGAADAVNMRTASEQVMG